jgi:hypothetical protein
MRLLLLALLCLAQPATATITVETVTAQVRALILADGMMVADDIDQFRTKIAGIAKAIVISPAVGCTPRKSQI